MTNYHRLRDPKQHTGSPHSARGQMSEVGLTMSRCRQRCIPSRSSRRQSVTLLFSASSSCPCGSHHCRYRHTSFTESPAVLFPWLGLLRLHLLAWLLSVKVPNLITSAQSLLSCEVTYSEVLASRTWTGLFWGEGWSSHDVWNDLGKALEMTLWVASV